MIVRLKGIKEVRSKGKTYYYHRKTMTRLPGLPGSAEFTAKLRDLERKGEKEAGKPGTLGHLINLYRASPEYIALAPGSKKVYSVFLNYMAPASSMRLSSITTPWLYEVRDRLAAKYSRTAANGTVRFLRTLFAWGKKRQICDANLAEDVDAIRRPKDAKVVNRRWSDEELEIVLAEVPAWMRVPIALAAYTGMRESDVVRVTWRAYDGQRFEARQQKTGLPIWVPAHYHLRAILDEQPRTSPQIVLGGRGRPLTVAGLRAGFFRIVGGLRDAGKVGPGLSFHGLRHTCGHRLAEIGCDPGTIAAVLGHASERTTAGYTKTARREHLATAAIERLEERDRNEKRKTERKTTP